MDLEITRILNTKTEDASALGEIYGILYEDIKRMAQYHLSRVPSGQTITPTVLVHEAYEKIYSALPRNYNNRTHFLRTLGLVMRSYLIDVLRSKKSLKHGEKIDDYTISGVTGEDDVGMDMMDFHNALLFISEIDPKFTEILELKLLFGFTFEEASEILEISSRQAMRRWKNAKALLISVLDENN